MLHAPLPAVLLIAGLAVVGVALSSVDALSLADDVGLDDGTVCDSVSGARGARAVERLTESGFPRVTEHPVEVYQLTQDGAPEAIVRIHWDAGTASCLPLTYTGPVNANIDLNPTAYGALVGELRLIIETGEFSRGHSVGNWLAIMWGSSIDVPHESSAAYKLKLAKWSAGWLA